MNDELSPDPLPNPRTDFQLGVLRGFLPDDRSAPILDAGCGTGRYARFLAARGYTAVEGVDILDQVPSAGFNYQQASLDHLPFQDSSFRLVFSHSVIYFLPDARLAVAELARVLEPGGYLIISGHTRNSLSTWYRRASIHLGGDKFSHLQAATFRATGEYEDAMRHAGIDVCLVDGFGTIPIAKSYYRPAANLLERKYGIRLPVPRSPSRFSSLGRVQSRAGYHFVLAGARQR